MRLNTLNTSLITIQNASVRDSVQFRQLLAVTVPPAAGFGLVAVFQLTAADLNSIKLLRNLATSQSNTYISIGTGLVLDVANVSSSAIASNSALGTVLFTQDITPPQLQNFDFNATSGILTLEFSEAVDELTFTPASLQLQSTAAGGGGAGTTLSLSSATVQPATGSQQGTVLSVALTTSDLNTLKTLTGLATSSSNTFVSVASSLVRDMAQLSLVAISSPTPALAVRNYTADVAAPTLTAFDLNMNTSVLVVDVLRNCQQLQLAISAPDFAESND